MNLNAGLNFSTAEIVIGGGAVMGSALAYFLASDPAFHGRIAVVEKDPSYAKAASALSASGIRQQYSCAINIRASLFGLSFLRNVGGILQVDAERPHIGLREAGYLTLASQAGLAILTENHGLQVAEGADIALCDVGRLGADFPWLSLAGVAAGAFGTTGEGWFDGYGLMQAFRRKARALGVAYIHGEVTGLDISGGRIGSVRLADGQKIACANFANMAGASGARQIAALAGLEIPVVARKRCVFSFTCRDRLPDFPLLIDPSGVYVRPEGEGFICGFSPDDISAPEAEDFNVDWPLFEDVIWPALASRVPAFENIRPGRAWAGHYDMNERDHNALVGAIPGLDNGYIAAGFSGHGIQHAPAVGRGLAEMMLHGRYITLDLADYDCRRLATGGLLLERNVI